MHIMGQTNSTIRSAIAELYNKHIIRMTHMYSAEKLYHDIRHTFCEKTMFSIQKSSLPKVVKNDHPLPYRFLQTPIGWPPYISGSQILCRKSLIWPI